MTDSNQPYITQVIVWPTVIDDPDGNPIGSEEGQIESGAYPAGVAYWVDEETGK